MSVEPVPVPRTEQLAELLAPVSVDEFFADYADRRALLIKGDPGKFADLEFDEEAFLDSAERFREEDQRLKAAIPSAGEAERYMPASPHEVRRLYREEGLTVCATALSDVNPALAAFAEGVRYGLSVPDLRFNAYLSPDASGFNLHYDVQPIFLVQMAGAKHWWYGSEPVSPMPRVYSSAWDSKPALETLQQTLLEPGDVLYLPAFTWHRARAEGFSLGITLGTKGAHNRSLRSALERSPLFGEWPVSGRVQPPIHPRHAGSPGVPEEAMQYLTEQVEAMRAWADALTVEHLWEAWVDDVQTPKGPQLPRVEAAVHSELIVKRRPGFPAQVQVRDDGRGRPVAVVSHAGHRVALDQELEPLLRWLLDTEDAMSVGDIVRRASDFGLTRAPAKTAIRELVAIGVLDAR